MGEWELVNIQGISGTGYYNYASVKRIADKIGGTVNYASELGYTSISGLWSTSTPQMNLLPVYIPDGSIYGLIFYGGWSYGSPDSVIYFVDLNESGDVASKGSIGGTPYVGYNMVAIYTDGDFSVIKTPEGNSYRNWFAFDTCENVLLDTDCFCCIGNSGSIVDLENPKLEDYLYIYAGSMIGGGNSIIQNDGSLFVEIVPHSAYYPSYSNSSLSANILTCNNIKKAIYDYSERYRIIEVNGVKFSMLTNKFYIPVE
jgi:hypothetical protein